MDLQDTLDASAEVVQTAEQLLPLLYADLKRFARRQRRAIHGVDTLQTTAVIHEAYLKLRTSPGFSNQVHFLRSAALAMRHVLLNYAREQVAVKRGDGATMVPIEEAPQLSGPSFEQLLEVNDALGKLQELSPRLAQVVECRFFGGYSDAETATALQLTERTVRRDWTKARAWLKQQLLVPPTD
jgi:RNA polymerase sigma factor (TIGR02999 family)